jgi:lipoprotein NlpI
MRLMALLILFFAMNSLALSQSLPDADFCAGSAGSIDDRITACSRTITSGTLSRATLSATFYNRGNLWRDKGDYDRAVADYNDAIRLNPQDSRSLANRGIAWAIKGDYDRAIADLNEVIRLDPQNALIFHNRGMTWRRKGDYDRAIADYNEAIRLDPQDADYFNSRGIAWQFKGDYDRAIADYNESIRLDPQNAKVFFNRGVTYFCLGQFDAAASDFMDRKRMNPKGAYPPIWRTLALLRGGKADLARSELQHAIQNSTKGEWPEPAMEFLSGQIDPSALLKAAENSDSPKTGQICEAHFILGEYHLINERRNEARTLLQVAEQECSKSQYQYEAAVAELKRLSR